MDRIIGTVLGHRYEILEKIGEGGMARVYKARCLLLNRMVAVKVLKTELVNDEEFVAKFEKESQAAASLSHQNIVNVYDVGTEGNINYIVMELVEGMTLKQFIKEHPGMIPDEKIMDISIQVARALDHAHHNHIIHRDIKPHNILINSKGLVKVADFGIARAITSSTMINTSEMVGSVHYSSPEQARGGFVDEKSDLYSLGVLMYELATKKMPYEGDTPISIALKHLKESVVKPSVINEDINQGLESIILKAMQKDTAYRYQTAQEMVDDLEVLINNPFENVPFYLPDETSPTMILPNISELDYDDEDDDGRGKPSKFAVMMLILAGMVTALMLFTVISFDKIKSSVTLSEVIMPDVVGSPYNDAVEELQALGLYVDISQKKFDNEIEKDSVISQSMNPGSKVKEGYTVSLVVSNGPVMVKTPNVSNKEITEAQLILENNNLYLGELQYVESDLPAGYVVSQEPRAGTDAVEKSEVSLKVSQGPENMPVTVPNITKRTLDEARKILDTIGLKVGSITYNYSSDYDEDDIMVQNIKAGSEVEPGTAINIVISKGPDPLAQPETDPGTEIGTGESDGTDTGTEEPAEPESNLVEKTYIIPLSFDGDSTVVRVEMVQDGVPSTVYEKEHNKSEENIRVVVKGSGVATINFYFGDTLVNSKVENFD